MRSPLLVLAACFALGIVAAHHTHAWAPGVPYLLVTSAACLLVGLLTLRAKWQRIPPVLALVGFVVAGAVAAQLFEHRFPPNHIARLRQLGIDLADAVRLDGRVVSTPVRASYGFQFDVEVRRVESCGRAHPLTGKVRLRLPLSGESETLAAAEALRLRYGDLIRVLVRLRRPRVYRNPGSFDFRRWLESVEDISYVGTIKSPLLIEKLPDGDRPTLAAFLEKTRLGLLHSIDRLYPPWSAAGRDGSVLKAVLLGDRSALDADTIENFRRTGLYHLLVISGLHVGLLAMVAAFLLRFLRLREAWRSALVMLFLLAYAALVEQRAPTLRATLMILLYLASRFLYRQESGLNAIGLAALLLLLHRPAWLFESGFQLSFSAALLIAGLAVPILERTPAAYLRALWRLHEVNWDISFEPRLAQFRLETRALLMRLTRPFYFFHERPRAAAAVVTAPLRIALWAANMLLFSAILQLGLLLPMAETFHRVTFAGIGLNALAIPLLTLLLGLAVPTVLLGATLPTLAVWPGKALAVIMRELFVLTDLPRLPAWLSYRVPEPPGWVSWGFALSLVAAALALARHRRTFWASVAAAGLFSALISLHPFPPRLPRGNLEVTALDCGGDALLVVFPAGTTMLVDGGGFSPRAGREGAFRGRRWEPGEDIVSPYLWWRGIKRIDVVALSHAHEDHLGGLTAVVRNFRVGEFWHGVNPPTPAYQEILAEVRQRGIPTRQLAAGDRIPLGGASVEILWPPAGHIVSQRPSNDDSVVMRIAQGEAAVLLPGDISQNVEQELVRSGVTLHSALLKVAHHGGGSSSSAAFLGRVSPAVALVTVEGGNPAANLPNPEVLARLRAAGARTYRTDEEGAVTVEMRGSQLSVRTYRTLPAD